MSFLPKNTLAIQRAQGLIFNDQSVDYTDDFELAQQCASGNKKAQKYLYELYAKNMYYICLRYCGDRDLANDLMHDGFVKVFTHLKTFRAEAKLKTWITRVMANHSISYCKAEARKQLTSFDKVEYGVIDDAKDPAEMLEEVKTQSAKDVLEAILELPAGYRTVLSMYALDGYSHKEIAAELGVTEGTSKSQLAKARKMLLKRVGKADKHE